MTASPTSRQLERLKSQLENLRAEVSDAAMSILAECAGLNKDPNIVKTVRFLDGIIGCIDDHFEKRRATLRKLSVAQL